MTPDRMIHSRHDAGFTLLETLAGFTILSLALIALFQGLSTALRREAGAKAREALRVEAVNRLNLAGVEAPLRAGTLTGHSPDGATWVETIRPYQDQQPLFAQGPAAFWIEVVVAAPASGLAPVRVETLKLQRGG